MEGGLVGSNHEGGLGGRNHEGGLGGRNHEGGLGIGIISRRRTGVGIMREG